MADQSLRLGLLVRMGCAVVALLALDAAATYWTSLYFANRVYDRWLVDSARSLTQAVRTESGRVSLQLAQPALDVFQYDEVDKTYFRISTAKRGVIAGEPQLPGLGAIPLDGIRLGDGKMNGEAVRIVATRLVPRGTDDDTVVAVAETLKKRATLAREVLLGMAAPQLALLAIAVLFAWAGVARGLKPLTDLAAELEARGRENLAPVPEAGLPRETRVLVRRLNELFARLGQSIEAQQRFVADAAHQLRTPLAAVLLHTERAERAPDPASERSALQALHRSVERAARVSQQLLALARAEPEVVDRRSLRPVDLSVVARRVGEEWVPRALERDIDFGLSVPADPARIAGDEVLLSEMLANLIDNALRYGRSPGKVTVIVNAQPGPNLVVEDDGPGIPLEDRDRVFERFFRGEGTEGPGCGLGLAIVRQIAASHRAVVAVSAGADGRGSRFVVEFPRVADQDE